MRGNRRVRSHAVAAPHWISDHQRYGSLRVWELITTAALSLSASGLQVHALNETAGRQHAKMPSFSASVIYGTRCTCKPRLMGHTVRGCAGGTTPGTHLMLRACRA